MNRHAGELRKHSIDFDFIARKLFTTRIISGVQERKEQRMHYKHETML
jgi:hypothetical protein